MNIRTGTIDDLQTIAEIEARSFPPAEAASSKVLKERLLRFPEHFWIMEETNGVISAFVCGMATDEPRLRDEMFENAELHQKAGDWQMIFAVATVPEYRGTRSCKCPFKWRHRRCKISRTERISLDL